MEGFKHIPLVFPRIPADEQLRASHDFLSRMCRRRLALLFSPEPVPLELVENAIRCASLAPSGANQHPWRLAVVRDADSKHKIREAAEAEERERYQRRDSPPNPES
jgi:nitroreductase